ncbi:SPX-domain-containing protein [Hysterangium stoloniferum]|nr:SPX-domain-containing protein [Hysterangium stoloniferum]
MKFSHSLKFNAVSDWWDYYIAYGYLKKQIYYLEKQQNRTSTPRYRDVDVEEGSALIGLTSSTDSHFRSLLDKELLKITSFYESQEKELFDELEKLDELVLSKETQGLLPDGAYIYDSGDEDDDDLDEILSSTAGKRRNSRAERRYSVSSSEDAATSIVSADLTPIEEDRALPQTSGTVSSGGRVGRILKSIVTDGHAQDSIWTANTSYAYDTRALFKRRITTLYLSLTSLRSYVELNHSGFRKILKKYDKVTYSELKDTYLNDVVDQAYPFLLTTRETLKEAITHVVMLYAKCVTRGDVSIANKQLRVHQREHIAWERDTVWRQMIGNERRVADDPSDTEPGPDLPGSKSSNFIIRTRYGTLKFKKKKIFVPIAAAVFIALLRGNVVEGVEANNCFAILVFATLLWATEAIPLFVTSLFVPLLLVTLRTVRSSDEKPERLKTADAAKFIFSAMFAPTIMLLIGGFTIASAVSKTNIDRVLITRVLSLAGKRPSVVLLTFMGVACFASMWISNVAAPTLCFSLIQLGIALAANVGGQSSPISSPQNLIAISYMNPPISWLEWFAVALPVSIISLILIWLLLVVSYRPGITADGEMLEIRPIRPTKEKFTLKQWWVTLVCFTTIGLWCIEPSIEDYVGDMGVIAILPIVAFFSTGVLKKDDFEQFLWSIVFLAMGGIALGKAVDSSGLLSIADNLVRGMIDGLSLYRVVLVLSVVVLIVSTFISHTIASVLLVPIAAEFGKQFDPPHPQLLIFITGLICSTGMGMPVSGFPNQTAANQVDELGKLYLTNIDFLKNGVPASIIATMQYASITWSSSYYNHGVYGISVCGI